MSARIFLDSNIVLYALNGGEDKKSIALDLLEAHPFLSTQVLAEVSSVCLKKFKFLSPVVDQWLTLLTRSAEVRVISVQEIREALKIGARYHYSFYDSLIIASALEAKAEILYTEDMHHGQAIESLKIINPFF